MDKVTRSRLPASLDNQPSAESPPRLAIDHLPVALHARAPLATARSSPGQVPGLPRRLPVKRRAASGSALDPGSSGFSTPRLSSGLCAALPMASASDGLSASIQLALLA
jgi:hypothetical protein